MKQKRWKLLFKKNEKVKEKPEGMKLYKKEWKIETLKNNVLTKKKENRRQEKGVFKNFLLTKQ